ncbi:MAG: (Fe-S)-binding protein [Halobacteriales archaeon]
MSEQVVRIDSEAWEAVDEATDGAASVCYQCGTCTATCPWGKFDGEPLSVRNLVRRAQTGQDGDGEAFADDLYRCLTCHACETQCPRDVDIVDAMLGLRELAFAEDEAPGRLENALWSVYEEDNPWERPASERADWLEAVPDDVDVQVGGEADVLYYVGCTPSYDPGLQDVPVAMVRLLDAADVDFAVLGEEESCCGDVVKQTGEPDFFAQLAESNSQQFEATGADTVVTSSPHCAETFIEDYDLDAEVVHYAEYLVDLLEADRLPIDDLDRDVTYHDPCDLSRGMDVVEAPRVVLDSVGTDLTEMEQHGSDGLCCGGGGGNMWQESELDERFADRRAKQADETGAAELVTACPYCVQNLEDGVKKTGVDMPVRDLTQVVIEALDATEEANA